MKKQVLFIHGAGEGAYEADKKLAASLQQLLGPEYEVHYPAMEDEENAPYEQWKHHIEKKARYDAGADYDHRPFSRSFNCH